MLEFFAGIDPGIFNNLIWVVLGVGLVVAFGFAWWKGEREKEAWNKAADRLGLDFIEGGLFSQPELQGSCRGKNVRAWVRSERRGGGKNSRTVYFTVIAVELDAACWQGLELTEHGFTDTIAKFFGGEDRETGDDSFDSDFRIKGVVDDQARECLRQKDVQDVLRQLARSYRKMKIEAGMLHVENKGRVTNAGKLIRRIGRAVDAAETLDRAAGVDDSDESQATDAAQTPMSDHGDAAMLFPDPDDEADEQWQRQPAETGEPVW